MSGLRVRDFSGKVVIITGSSSGIGAGIALEFARAGALVVVNGLESDLVSDVAQQCMKCSPNGLKPLQVVADITIENECKRLIDSTIKEFGKLDILVNNAGISKMCAIEDTNVLNKFDKVFNTNLRSIVYLTHLSVGYLEKTKGNIVNISSICSQKIYPMNSIYSMSKSALDMFTKCLALELGPKGIRVNSVNPHGVKTNIGNDLGLTKEQLNHLMQTISLNILLGREGTPGDMANAVLFLASDESSFVTGINFFVDGGDRWK